MASTTFKDYVLDQLDGIRSLRCRAMFGGFGLYREDNFFGIIFDGKFYLKTDGSSKKEFILCGMKPFKPNPRQTLKSYYQVPDEVLDDREQLIAWAQRAAKLRKKKPTP